MSKRYVIQINLSTGENAQWTNVEHPSGGDWMTRSSKTALGDAARLYRNGETRELRIAVSKPVYSVTPFAEGTFEHVKLLAQITQDLADEAAKYGMPDDEADSDYVAPVDLDELESDVAPAQFEIVDESIAVTHGDDPTGN
jgi:hypothetical protein